MLLPQLHGSKRFRVAPSLAWRDNMRGDTDKKYKMAKFRSLQRIHAEFRNSEVITKSFK